MDILTEAEIQVLIAHLELVDPKETPNNNHYAFYPKTLEEAARYFRATLEDWGAAYEWLQAKGLLVTEDGMHVMTPEGVRVARWWRDERPPIWYFYKEYYTDAPRSSAYAAFCEQLYGRYLNQANFSDMAQLDKLIKVAQFSPGSRVLDLGCGIGMIAEYVAEVTGAQVWGMDYVPEAIACAQVRTADKRSQLAFRVGNLDELPYAPGSFDAVISIDTLYMPKDLGATLAQTRRLLVPGGQMLIFWMEMLWDEQASRTVLQADHTTLAQALRRLGLAFRTWDFSAATYAMMQRKRTLAEAMREDFAAEGRLFLYDLLMMESESNPAPYAPETAMMARYLVQVTI